MTMTPWAVVRDHFVGGLAALFAWLNLYFSLFLSELYDEPFFAMFSNQSLTVSSLWVLLHFIIIYYYFLMWIAATDVFSLDTRSLALFRILLGWVQMYNIVQASSGPSVAFCFISLFWNQYEFMFAQRIISAELFLSDDGWVSRSETIKLVRVPHIVWMHACANISSSDTECPDWFAVEPVERIYLSGKFFCQ